MTTYSLRKSCNITARDWPGHRQTHLHVNHVDCLKGTLPSVKKRCPCCKESLCSLALKSSAGALFGNKVIGKQRQTKRTILQFVPELLLCMECMQRQKCEAESRMLSFQFWTLSVRQQLRVGGDLLMIWTCMIILIYVAFQVSWTTITFTVIA